MNRSLRAVGFTMSIALWVLSALAPVSAEDDESSALVADSAQRRDVAGDIGDAREARRGRLAAGSVSTA